MIKKVKWKDAKDRKIGNEREEEKWKLKESNGQRKG
jgi:hypothetical protein